MVSRRVFIAGLSATTGLAACSNGVGSNGGPTIDARVNVARDYLFQSFPGTRDLAARSAGVLYMPLVTEAGLGVGASYGRGALRINGATVDYYSSAKGSIGFQIGAQQYAHALFFMTPTALADFRSSRGWVAGADLRYATPDQGGSIGKDTTEIDPVVALVYGQSGLIAGATIAGTKYTRIIP